MARNVLLFAWLVSGDRRYVFRWCRSTAVGPRSWVDVLPVFVPGTPANRNGCPST